MLGAIDSSGGLSYRTHVGSTTAEVFVSFLQQLLGERSGKIHLIIDNLSIHKAARVKKFLDSEEVRDRMEIHRNQ